MDDLIGEFITETSESLAVLDRELGKLETSPNDPALLSTILRLVHTIKSTCGFLELPRLEAMAQACETALGNIRDGEVPAAAPAIALVLEALQQIKTIIDYLAQHGQEPQGDDRDLLTRLQQVASVQTSVSMPAASVTPRDVLRPTLTQAPNAFTLPPMALPVIVPPPTAKKETIPVNTTLLETVRQVIGELVYTRNHLRHRLREQRDMQLTKPVQKLSRIANLLQKAVQAISDQPLAVAKILVVEAAGRRWGLHHEMIEEVLPIDAQHRVEKIHASEVVQWRDQLLPLVRLQTLLDPQAQKGAPPSGYIAVMRGTGTSLGLIVERVDELEEIMLQPVSQHIQPRGLYSHSAVLGDDSVILILDNEALLAPICAPPSPAKTPAAQPETAARFLVFRAGGNEKALPVEQILRLELVDTSQITFADGQRMMTYRDELLPLDIWPGSTLPRRRKLEVILLRNKTGLVVDALLEIHNAQTLAPHLPIIDLASIPQL